MNGMISEVTRYRKVKSLSLGFAGGFSIAEPVIARRRAVTTFVTLPPIEDFGVLNKLMICGVFRFEKVLELNGVPFLVLVMLTKST